MCFAHMMTGRLVVGSILLSANYITCSDNRLKTSIHRGIGQNMLSVMLSQEVHDKMPRSC